MKKFIYRGIEIIGELVEETQESYIISFENDQKTIEKELTKVEEIEKTPDFSKAIEYYNDGRAIKWTIEKAKQWERYHNILKEKGYKIEYVLGSVYFKVDGGKKMMPSEVNKFIKSL